jgi:hypothetical protein
MYICIYADSFDILLDSLTFGKDFHVVHERCCPIILSLTSQYDFGVKVILASQNALGSTPSASIFCKTLWEISIISSLNMLIVHK